MMKRFLGARPHNERGFTTVWVLGLAIIIMVLGLAVFDVWSVYTRQRALTAHADSAAAAAAQAIDLSAYQSTPSRLALLTGDATSLAEARLRADFPGHSVSVSSIEVGRTCTGTPSDGQLIACVSVDNTTNPNKPTVTVTVRQKANFTVFKLVGYADQTVSASGTAGPR